MSHPTLKTLSRFLDKCLPPSKSDSLTSHIKECKRCKRRISIFAKLEQIMTSRKELADSFTDDLVASLGEVKRIKQPTIAKIKGIVGYVTVYRNSDEQGVDGFIGMGLKKGDSITLLGNSLALIELTDGSNIWLNKDTEVDFLTGVHKLSLRSGEIFAMMKPQRAAFTIKTPSAVLEILGTDFDAVVNEKEETTLSVLKGRVSFKNNAGATLVKKNHQVSASKHRAPVASKAKNPSSIASWANPIRLSKDRKGFMMKKTILWLAVALVVVGGYFVCKQTFRVGPASADTEVIYSHDLLPGMEWIEQPEDYDQYTVSQSPNGAYHAFLSSHQTDWQGATEVINIVALNTDELQVVETSYPESNGRIRNLAWFSDSSRIAYIDRWEAHTPDPNEPIPKTICHYVLHVYDMRTKTSIAVMELDSRAEPSGFWVSNNDEIFLLTSGERGTSNLNMLTFADNKLVSTRPIPMPRFLFYRMHLLPGRNELWYLSSINFDQPYQTFSIGYMDLDEDIPSPRTVVENSLALEWDIKEEFFVFRTDGGFFLADHDMKDVRALYTGDVSRIPKMVGVSYDMSSIFFEGCKAQRLLRKDTTTYGKPSGMGIYSWPIPKEAPPDGEAMVIRVNGVKILRTKP